MRAVLLLLAGLDLFLLALLFRLLALHRLRGAGLADGVDQVEQFTGREAEPVQLDGRRRGADHKENATHIAKKTSAPMADPTNRPATMTRGRIMASL